MAIPGDAIRNVFTSQISGMKDVAQAAVTSRTKTAEKLSETLQNAQSKGTEKTHPVAKQAAATLGALIGQALKPFVFNEGKAREELKTAFADSGVSFDGADAKTLKAMRNDLRTIENIVNKYMDNQGTADVVSLKLDGIKIGGYSGKSKEDR